MPESGARPGQNGDRTGSPEVCNFPGNQLNRLSSKGFGAFFNRGSEGDRTGIKLNPCKIDEDGRTVHEGCYAVRLLNAPPKKKTHHEEGWRGFGWRFTRIVGKRFRCEIGFFGEYRGTI